jgi:hypothetical protein
MKYAPWKHFTDAGERSSGIDWHGEAGVFALVHYFDR